MSLSPRDARRRRRAGVRAMTAMKVMTVMVSSRPPASGRGLLIEALPCVALHLVGLVRVRRGHRRVASNAKRVFPKRVSHEQDRRAWRPSASDSTASASKPDSSAVVEHLPTQGLCICAQIADAEQRDSKSTPSVDRSPRRESGRHRVRQRRWWGLRSVWWASW